MEAQADQSSAGNVSSSEFVFPSIAQRGLSDGTVREFESAYGAWGQHAVLTKGLK
jgi:hypothetical protein